VQGHVAATGSDAGGAQPRDRPHHQARGVPVINRARCERGQGRNVVARLCEPVRTASQQFQSRRRDHVAGRLRDRAAGRQGHVTAAGLQGNAGQSVRLAQELLAVVARRIGDQGTGLDVQRVEAGPDPVGCRDRHDRPRHRPHAGHRSHVRLQGGRCPAACRHVLSYGHIARHGLQRNRAGLADRSGRCRKAVARRHGSYREPVAVLELNHPRRRRSGRERTGHRVGGSVQIHVSAGPCPQIPRRDHVAGCLQDAFRAGVQPHRISAGRHRRVNLQVAAGCAYFDVAGRGDGLRQRDSAGNIGEQNITAGHGGQAARAAHGRDVDVAAAGVPQKDAAGRGRRGEVCQATSFDRVGG